jgi:hypothetical protein
VPPAPGAHREPAPRGRAAGSNLVIGLADVAVRSGKALQVGDRFCVPNNYVAHIQHSTRTGLLPPAADVPLRGLWAAMCRYCCKSPKLPGPKFLAVKRSDLRPPINVAPITLPRSPASLSSGNEVPHIFTRKSRLRSKEFLISSAKRLLQQNLPQGDICSAANLSPTRSPHRPATKAT